MDTRRLQLTVEYLRVLDLDGGASVADIREAYRILVRTWDPDRPGYDVRVRAASERKHAEVRHAYEWLRENADLVVAQTTDAGTQLGRESGASTAGTSFLTPLMRALKLDRVPPRLAFYYVILVGLLVFGIVFVAAWNPKAWFGPLL